MQMKEGQKLDCKKRKVNDEASKEAKSDCVRQLSKRQRIKQNKREKRRKTDIIKTDAPLNVIWDILRAYVKSKTDDLKLDKLEEHHVKRKILTDVQGDTKVSFEQAEDEGLKAIKNVIR